VTHETWQDLNDWVDGALDREASERVETHVMGCAACREEVAAIEGIRALAPRLLEGGPAVTAPPPRVRGRRRGRGWVWAGPALAIGLAAGALVWVRTPDASVEDDAVVEFRTDDRAAVEARVAEQLAIIDAAITELRVLLEEQPANAALRATLAVAERDRSALGAMAREVLQGAYPGGGM
jgi:anti-sigma factor RsiW